MPLVWDTGAYDGSWPLITPKTPFQRCHRLSHTGEFLRSGTKSTRALRPHIFTRSSNLTDLPEVIRASGGLPGHCARKKKEPTSSWNFYPARKPRWTGFTSNTPRSDRWPDFYTCSRTRVMPGEDFIPGRLSSFSYRPM